MQDSSLKEAIKQGDYPTAWKLLFSRVNSVSDYSELSSLCRNYNKLLKQSSLPASGKKIKLAILSAATTDMLYQPLDLMLKGLGIDCHLHRGEFGTFAQDMMDPNSEVARFKPDVSVLIASPLQQPRWPEPHSSLSEVEDLASEVSQWWIGLGKKLHENTGSEVVMGNFHLLPGKPHGNLSAKLPWSKNNFITRLNKMIGDSAPSFLHLVDVHWLASSYGVRNWFDLRYWYHAKQPVSFECLPAYVKNFAGVIAAIYGKTAKCAVVDLDNTLWGGVVGDDGPEGIVIGEGDAVGEAYKAFQQYLAELKQRGVVLAVCSKNEEKNALAPFDANPEMVLKRGDFVSFKANWIGKPDNLRNIADELNLGIDSFVFIDDNPVEREHVRQRIPGIRIIDLDEDPSTYIQALNDSVLFETVSVSLEDQKRTEQYQDNQQRKSMLETLEDYDSYLQSLEQKAVIEPFQPLHLERITQLINKSNQFNLTTLRQSLSDVQKLMNRKDVITATIRLKDRFGDNGLISVLFGTIKNKEFFIDEWLMSCRVLKRGVENLLCNWLVIEAQNHSLEGIIGCYIPSGKNNLVKNHYAKLGFLPVENKETGETTWWRLPVEGYRPFKVAIQQVEEYS